MNPFVVTCFEKYAERIVEGTGESFRSLTYPESPDGRRVALVVRWNMGAAPVRVRRKRREALSIDLPHVRDVWEID